jgi:hypothetical protein
MVRISGIALLLCLVFVAPSSARAASPVCPDAGLLTPVGKALNLPSPNCTGVSGQFTIQVVNPPQHGTITPGSPNVYTPFGRYRGEDQFRYTITDANGVSNVATVTILVNTPPTCNDGTATVVANQRLVFNDFDCDEVDGDVVWVDAGQPQHGTITYPGDGTVVYTPNPGYVGTDSFIYFAWEEDALGLDSDDATMSITVTSPPPITRTPIQLPLPPVAAPKPPADVTAPVVALKNASKKQAVAIALTTSENSTATLTLTLDKATARKLKLSRTVGQVKAALTPGTATVPVKLSAKARKAFKKLKRVKLTLTAVVTDTAGNRITKTLAVTLKR